ncbi:bifunctional adenosine 5'-phosphosulfate phosphorylase/adenylylsulfatase HINT4-like [Raphanus sativus]|uniref:Bifunctional adenosine 5'-phosphosulfate phosphorylase/adenylylsulfatase HINT4-like n=1 Tax=Raphanus sativus TaxID=3726 RepID=A0A9W3DKS3_RAPSA|nr:bifunctional adenosine 5'-phosphosulfate phosphorylase/adenylylsulfatase HINT4-like [Raphanus sativus]
MSEQTSSVLSFEIEIQFSDLISNSKSRYVRNLEGREMAGTNQFCIFCQIIRNPTTNTRLLHADEKVVAFQDIKPAAQRHYLVM